METERRFRMADEFVTYVTGITVIRRGWLEWSQDSAVSGRPSSEKLLTINNLS